MRILCTSQVLNLEISPKKQNETSSREGRKIRQCLVSELAEGDLGGTDVLTTTGAALWYEQGERSSPGDPYQQFGCQTPRLQEIQAITHSFPKQKGRVQRSTAHGQAV